MRILRNIFIKIIKIIIVIRMKRDSKHSFPSRFNFQRLISLTPPPPLLELEAWSLDNIYYLCPHFSKTVSPKNGRNQVSIFGFYVFFGNITLLSAKK